MLLESAAISVALTEDPSNTSVPNTRSVWLFSDIFLLRKNFGCNSFDFHKSFGDFTVSEDEKHISGVKNTLHRLHLFSSTKSYGHLL